MDHFRPYPIDNGLNTWGGVHENYAVQVGGSGGRVMAREWSLTLAQAQELCRELETAFDIGADSRAAA